MNAESNAIDALPIESRAVAPAVISEPRRLFWSIRREIWENRSIYLAPLAAAALILIGLVIGALRLMHGVNVSVYTTNTGSTYSSSTRFNLLDGSHNSQIWSVMQQTYSVTAALIMLTTFIVAIFYCLEALHGERRDRSILFWKSLPVSDLTTVLSKASIPLLVLPVVTFVVIAVTQLLMLLINAAFLAGAGQSVAQLHQLPLFQMWLALLYHLALVHVLWYAPIYGWLLLVSAWARRATLLWATLPLFAVTILEKLAFGTFYFGEMLKDRFSGGLPGASPMMNGASSGVSMSPLANLTPGAFFSSPGLWIGLAVAAAFLAAAIQLRRYRGPL